jgi:predicted DNA-binding transcriptional regulator YafY
MPEMSSNARIVSMMRLLADPLSPVDVKSLAGHFNTSEKTIRRDLKELKNQGIQLLEATGQKNQKVYSLERSSLPPMHLTFDEAMAIFLGKSQLIAFHGSGVEDAANSAFEKIRLWLGKFEASYVEKISARIHFARQHGIRADQSEVVDSIMIALEDSLALFIEYQSAQSTEPLTYDIYPYGLAEHRGSLYVVGHSCHHDEIRTWKVDRIRSTGHTPFPFKRPPDFNISKFFEGAFSIVMGRQQQTVRVRFTGTAVPYVCEKKFHTSQKIQHQSDGSVMIELTLNSLLEVKSWILSFGFKAEVLEPQELRTTILDELRQMGKNYGLSIYKSNSLPDSTQHLHKEKD